jgi:hypothetical protein
VGRYNAFAIGGAINEAALRTLQTPILTAELQRRWAAARAATERKQIDVPPMQNDNDRLGGNVKYFADLPATKGYQLMVVFPRDDLMTFGSQGPFWRRPHPTRQRRCGAVPSNVSRAVIWNWDSPALGILP